MKEIKQKTKLNKIALAVLLLLITSGCVTNPAESNKTAYSCESGQ